MPVPMAALSIVCRHGGLLSERRGCFRLWAVVRSKKLPEAPELILAERGDTWLV